MNKEKLTKALSAIAKEEARVRKILLSKSYENVKDITVLLELIQGEPVYSLDLYDEDLNNVTVRVPFDDMKFALTTEDWRRIMEEFDEDLHHHILQKMVFAQISDTQDIAEHCGDKEILAEIELASTPKGEIRQ